MRQSLARHLYWLAHLVAPKPYTSGTSSSFYLVTRDGVWKTTGGQSWERSITK